MTVFAKNAKRPRKPRTSTSVLPATRSRLVAGELHEITHNDVTIRRRRCECSYSDSWRNTGSSYNDRDSDSESCDKPAGSPKSYNDSPPSSSREPSFDEIESKSTSTMATKEPRPKKETKNYVAPEKKVDLGAAANYKGDTATTAPATGTGTSTASAELLDIDLFNPGSAAAAKQDDFANFKAFESSQPADDEFADFESAFTTNPAVNPAVSPSPVVNPVAQPPQPQLINDLFDLNTQPMNVNPVPVANAVPAATLFDAFNGNNNALTPQQLTPTHAAQSLPAETKSQQQFKNTTWDGITGNLNINLDNLGKKSEQKQAPSMNQLASGMSTLSIRPQMSPSHGFANFGKSE